MNKRTYLGIAILVSVAMFMAYTGLANFDMTGRQILLTFWPRYIICGILAFIGMALLYRE